MGLKLLIATIFFAGVTIGAGLTPAFMFGDFINPFKTMKKKVSNSSNVVAFFAISLFLTVVCLILTFILK